MLGWVSAVCCNDGLGYVVEVPIEVGDDGDGGYSPLAPAMSFWWKRAEGQGEEDDDVCGHDEEAWS